MSDETPRLHLAQLVSLQELNAVTWNEALAQIDALVDLCLLGQYVDTPPASPSDGDAYLTGGAPTGLWIGYAYKIAVCLDGAWRFYTPFNGLRAYVTSTGTLIVYFSGAWMAIGSTDFATKAGTETFSGKTFSGATAFPSNTIIDAGGKVGIGRSSPSVALEVWSSTGIQNYRFNAGINGGHMAVGHSRDTTIGSMAYLLMNDQIGGILCQSVNGASFTTSGGVYWLADENHASGSLGTRIEFRTTGNGSASTSVRLSVSNAGAVTPGTDNTQNFGSSSLRWANIYAGNGSIITTSDAAEKLNVRTLSETELAVAQELAAQVRIFQYVSAVGEKGAGAARLHAGLVADDVYAVFERHGLDPERYGICCRDPLTKTVVETRTVTRIVPRKETVAVSRERIDIVDGKAVLTFEDAQEEREAFQELPLFDAKGRPVLDAGGNPRTHRIPVLDTVEETETVEATVTDCDEHGLPKTRLGLRYDELAQFMLAGLLSLAVISPASSG